AFPNDEPSAEVIASRLRAAGIAARVDRGLAVGFQVPARGQVTVLVDERAAQRAHKILGTTPHEEGPPSPLMRVAVAVLIAALILGFIAVVVSTITG
ncbi:MAG: hypothetical protein ABJB39_10340, partial [Chloroflexota bacterium]